jgi:hypothetical protein
MSKENPNIMLNKSANKKDSTKLNSKSKEKHSNKKEEIIKDRINKPNDLKNFDAMTHLRQNIIRFDKNCSEPIKDFSYYCFSCKHSVCNECGVYDHKEHLLIQRDNCLNYDNSFFNEISKVIEKGINIDIEKKQIKENITKSIKLVKEQLDILEKEKLKEIDSIFIEIKNNYINLKENYLKTKEIIENYYIINKNFFNIHIKITDKENNNELENSNNNKKQHEENPYMTYLNDNEIGPNRDMDNTIFLMNFELMNLCDNKNLIILDISNDINNKIANISNIIEQKTNSIISQIKNDYLNFGENGIISKFDDFYWDVKIRCEKYNEHISQFKNTIYDIYKRNRSFDKLKDFLSLFDSKNHKGKDVLFNQQFFIKMNDLSSFKNDQAKNLSKNLCKSHGKIRSTSKKNFYRQTSQNNSLKSKESKTNEKMKMTNNLINKGIDKYSNKGTNNNESKNGIKRSNSNLFGKNNSLMDNNYNSLIIDKDNIILDQRVLQRFFAYSILDFYSKYFKTINVEDEYNCDSYDIHNIYNMAIKDDEGTKLKRKNTDIKKINKNRSVKLNRNSERKFKKIVNGNIYNINNIKNIKDNEFNSNNSNLYERNGNIHNMKLNRNKTYIKSSSLISYYSERYMQLKEKVKPIIGTNFVQFFEPMTNRITKMQLPLSKEKHGYSVFPEGCRHILIDSELFITGGSDNCGYPINIVLMLNIEIGELTRLSNLNDNHSYHSLEYLENFDSIVLIGGKNSSSCEIMDIDSKKWVKLPSLNYARANSNIYYNNVTSDLFVLFGMEGEMNEKAQNTDAIEVLELNDIIGGWMKVEYYKSVNFDMKNQYCVTLPFTRDKLIVYGGTTARSIEKGIFALFDMIKNEIIKVDSQTMDLIKLEENKIRSFDTALEKIMQ